MKIALVVHDFTVTEGHGRYVVELARELSAEHEVHVFASTFQDIDLPGVTRHKVWTIQKPYIAKVMCFLALSSILIKRKKFDIIHTQGICTLKATIVTCQFCQAAWREVFLSGATESVPLLKRLYYRFLMGIIVFLEKVLYRKDAVKRIIVGSENVKRELVKFYRADAAKIDIVHYGVNLNEFAPDEKARFRDEIRKKYAIPPDVPTLMFAGEYKRKGLGHLLRALAEFRGVNFRLLVVGYGDDAFFRKLAQDLGIGADVIFTGKVYDIHRYYAAADIFVFPTLYEPFGLVIVEAMVAGCATVTSRAAGAAELIEHGKDGLVLENPGNPAEIAAAIRTLFEDDALRQKLGRNAVRKMKKFPWKKMADTIEAIYRSVLR